jgi:hypothetical protein
LLASEAQRAAATQLFQILKQAVDALIKDKHPLPTGTVHAAVHPTCLNIDIELGCGNAQYWSLEPVIQFLNGVLHPEGIRSDEGILEDCDQISRAIEALDRLRSEIQEKDRVQDGLHFISEVNFIAIHYRKLKNALTLALIKAMALAAYFDTPPTRAKLLDRSLECLLIQNQGAYYCQLKPTCLSSYVLLDCIVKYSRHLPSH